MRTDDILVEGVVVNDNVTPGDDIADIEVGDGDAGSGASSSTSVLGVLMIMSPPSWSSGDAKGREEEGSGDRKANHGDVLLVSFLKLMSEGVEV